MLERQVTSNEWRGTVLVSHRSQHEIEIMKKFETLKAIVAPMDRPNVDTDAIIPKQFLKSIKRSGFGPNLFDEWRYLDHGEPGMDNSKRSVNPEFVLNLPRDQGAQVLVARENFGCGSSREHAPWALEDYGFRVIIAPSFADIFFSNCFKNGILPIVLDEKIVDDLFNEIEVNEDYQLEVNLEAQTIARPTGDTIAFDVDPFRKHCLLNGLDDISLTLQHVDDIKAYEARRKQEAPWLF
jgi:3-isopropylmalate/(R)-2-methylmalate dehydratase small subunit